MRHIIQKNAPYTHRSGEIFCQALSLSLFIGQASVCACTASYLHYPSHIPYCNLLYALICFRIRTILLAFRRASVCVCLYGFVSALSLAQHHVLASPRKRGGGTAVEVFRLAVQYSDSPAFTILKLFRAVTVGIAPHPHHQ